MKYPYPDKTKISDAWKKYCEDQHPHDKKIQYEMIVSNETGGKYRSEFVVFCHAYHIGYITSQIDIENSIQAFKQDGPR